MKRTIFGSISSLDQTIMDLKISGAIESSDDVVDMFKLMEQQQDLADKTSELKFISGLMDEAEASIERLESIKTVIEKYGISKSMMMIADPDGELVSAGVCASYEGLNDLPMKDSESDATVESIGSTIGTITTRIGEFFNVAGNKLVNWGESVHRLFVSYEHSLIEASKQLNLKSVNDEMFPERTATTFSKSDFDSAINISEHLIRLVGSNTLNKVANDIERIMMGTSLDRDHIAVATKKAGDRVSDLSSNSDVEKFVGLNISLTSEGGIGSVQNVRPLVSPKRMSISELGWNADDVRTMVKKSLSLLTAAKVLNSSIDAVSKSCDNMATIMKKQNTDTADFAKDTKVAYNLAVAETKNIIMANKAILKATVQTINRIAASSISLANAALKIAE